MHLPLAKPLTDALRQVQILSQQGIKEVTLLGQNVNSYADDSATLGQQKVSQADPDADPFAVYARVSFLPCGPRGMPCCTSQASCMLLLHHHMLHHLVCKLQLDVSRCQGLLSMLCSGACTHTLRVSIVACHAGVVMLCWLCCAFHAVLVPQGCCGAAGIPERVQAKAEWDRVLC